MIYNISNFIIVQDLNGDEKLVYSTLSTSMIVLQRNIYEDVFLFKRFNEHDDLCKELEEMGFLFKGSSRQQLEDLSRIRNEIVETDHGITAVTIAPTMDCNARCYYCFENGAEKGTMSVETAEAVAEFLIEHCTSGELYIAWFGGEPLLATSVINLINEKLIRADIKVESTITTNGILIDEKIIKMMRNWNTQRVQITLDGIGENYNKIKSYCLKIKDPFQQILKNIELLISNDFNVHLRVNYKSIDEKNVNETMDFLHKRFGGYEHLYLYGAPLDLPELKGYSEFDKEEGEIFLKVLKKSLDYGYENDELNFSALRVSEDYNIALGEYMLAPFPAACFMVNKNRYAIDDKGYLYKCQKHLGKSEFNCGDVKNGIKYNDIYQHYCTPKLHDEGCEKCFMLPICQGGCNANRLLYGNKFACPPSKSIAPQLVKAYYEYIMKGGESDESD